MDLRRALEEAQSLPDDALEREMANPSGFIPGYIVASEINERKALRREKFAKGGLVSGDSVVAQINPFYTYVMGLKHQSDLVEAPAVRDGIMPRPPTPAPAANPVGLETLIPLQPGTPQPPKKYASGGLVMMTPYQRALMDAIARRESAGKYNVRYGGATFSDFTRHPNIPERIRSGPNKGKYSTAAGRYQFIYPTWKTYKQRLGLPDFSPASQDRAAYELAKDDFRRRHGGNLDEFLQRGEIPTVAKHLRATWTSLPGGIEAGQKMTGFTDYYNQRLGYYMNNPELTRGAPMGGQSPVPQDVPIPMARPDYQSPVQVADVVAPNAAPVVPTVRATPIPETPKQAALQQQQNIPVPTAAPARPAPTPSYADLNPARFGDPVQPVAPRQAFQIAPNAMPQPVPTQVAQTPAAAVNPSYVMPPSAGLPALAGAQAAQAAQAGQAAAGAAQAAQAAQAASAASAASQAASAAAPAAAASPFGGLFSLMAMAASQPPAPAPVGGGPMKPRYKTDPETETIATSHTPNVYLEKKKRRRARFPIV